MTMDVIVAVVEDGAVRGYHRGKDRALTQTAMLAVGDHVKPEQLAVIMADLGDALGWKGLGPPVPTETVQPRKVADPPQPALPATRDVLKRGRRTNAETAAEIDRLVAAVDAAPDGITPKDLARLVWPRERYRHTTYMRTLSRMSAAEQQRRVHVARVNGNITVHPMQPDRHPDGPGEP